MKNKNLSVIDIFNSLSDESLISIAENDWESLEKLCMALTIDIQLLKEEIELFQRNSLKKNLAS